MQYVTVNELREKFLHFFEERGHLRAPSYSLVPENNPSLLLINAGMAPLKPFFTGEQTPPAPRMATCQKCIRTLDIERVGKTARHGTFFEMLGSFSFGDYFKREACALAWQFVTDVLGIPPERLYVSTYVEDDETWDIWTKEIGVAQSHMVRLGKEDNFWEIGQGPCGPCSELYIDRGADPACTSDHCAPGCDCDRFVEFWNLVFTQFSNDGAGNYTPLAQKNIDTGMGLERLAVIMQNADSIFEIDTMRAVLDAVAARAEIPYKSDKKADVSMRIICDHVRAAVFLVGDGVLPANEGRGYILRRLLRRAARHGKLLSIDGMFLEGLAKIVIEQNRDAYPLLAQKEAFILQMVSEEEKRFTKTIDAGLAMLSDLIARGEVTAEAVFKLYDTFGFPLDLTEEICADAGIAIDRNAFEALMQQQRTRARAAQSALGDRGWQSGGAADFKDLETQFTGYDATEQATRVLFAGKDGENDTLVLLQSPFYAEQGGQQGDTGTVAGKNGARMTVTAAKKVQGDVILLQGKITQGAFAVGDEVTAAVDTARRRRLSAAHTATHLLQAALRAVLGDHVGQSGSQVSENALRFDFTHFSALKEAEIRAAEALCNDVILQALPVTAEQMPLAEARKRRVTALFDDKYGETVRVVTVGDFSCELCGGTHVCNTGAIGLLKICAEGSVSAGVRRIEAVVGTHVLDLLYEKEALLSDLAARLKIGAAELPGRIAGLAEDNKALRAALTAMESRAAAAGVAALLEKAEDVGGIAFVAAVLGDVKPDALRTMGDALVEKEPAVAALLAAAGDGKITFLAVCGAAAVARGAHAGTLVREAARMTGGSGGGKPGSAMAGGKDASKLPEALTAARDALRAML